MSITVQESRDYYEAFYPCLRAEITFGPPLRLGATTVYHLKDRFTGWFYRIGAREQFVFSRMDGSRSLRQIGEEYAAEFGRSLNEQSWGNLFRIIEKRQMLAGAIDSEKLDTWKQEAKQKKREGARGLLRRRFALVEPDRFLERILPWFAFAFHPAFIALALLGIVGLEIFVGINIRSITLELVESYHQPLNIALFLVVGWLFAAVHECAHGLTCKKYGGSVSEIGIFWRYLSFFPYCKIDDVLLFSKRRHRIYTVLAGVFTNLLCSTPFGIIWWLAPTHSVLSEVSSFMLISFNLSSFFNLVPFIELDGYFSLNHFLGTVDLRKEAHFYWKRGALKLLLKKGEGNANRGYTRRDISIYFTYGLFSLLFTTAFLVGTLIGWFFFGQRWFGTTITLLLLGVCVLLFLLRGPGKTWLERRFHVRERWNVFSKRLGIGQKKEAQS
jgi:putative peptide zinc metalloprotease protein